MIKKILLQIILTACIHISYAQHSITLIQDLEVEHMMERYVEKNRSIQYITGWRIQIISTDDRRIMERERENFKRKYPDIKTEWRHVSPFFQVRGGAFRNKMQLMPFLLEVREAFPLTTAVQEDIKITEFISQ